MRLLWEPWSNNITGDQDMADFALKSAIFHDRGFILARAVSVVMDWTKGEMAELLMNSAIVESR